MRAIVTFVVWVSAWSPIWASGQEPVAEFRPEGLWRLLANNYTATVEFSDRGMCLIAYQSAGFSEYRGCGWDTSGRTVNLYSWESSEWVPVPLVAASDVELELASDRRVVFHRLTWKRH